MPLVTVVEPETNRELLCMLRRRFKLANGEERCLCLPLDHPIDVLRGEGLDESEDLSDIEDDDCCRSSPTWPPRSRRRACSCSAARSA